MYPSGIDFDKKVKYNSKQMGSCTLYNMHTTEDNMDAGKSPLR